MTPRLLAYVWLGLVVFVYAYARLVRRAWPNGHPWSGLAWLLMAAGIFIGNNPATGRLSIYSGLCFALGFLSAMIWLFMPSKPQESAPPPVQNARA